MIKERNELATSALSGLFDFWRTKHCGEKPPIASTIAPADLRPWKDNIVIFEVIGDGDYVYSYYGQALASAFGHSRLGATLDELPPEQRAILLPEYETVRREQVPVARIYTADFNGTTRSWERLALPLSSDGEVIDKLLVAAYELDPEIAELALAIAAEADTGVGTVAGAAERTDETDETGSPTADTTTSDSGVGDAEAADAVADETVELTAEATDDVTNTESASQDSRPDSSDSSPSLVETGIPSLDLSCLVKPAAPNGDGTDTDTDTDHSIASTGVPA